MSAIQSLLVSCLLAAAAALHHPHPLTSPPPRQHQTTQRQNSSPTVQLSGADETVPLKQYPTTSIIYLQRLPRGLHSQHVLTKSSRTRTDNSRSFTVGNGTPFSSNHRLTASKSLSKMIIPSGTDRPASYAGRVTLKSLPSPPVLSRRRRDLSDLTAVPPAELLTLKSLQNLGSLLAGILGMFFGPFGPVVSAVATPFISDIVYAVAGYMS